jgi:paraquat-inducible protein B
MPSSADTLFAPETGPLPPEVEIKRRRGPSIIWLIPIVAALLGGYLAWITLQARGPEVVVTFKEASGLEAGRTKVRYKDVEVGEVVGVGLTEDLAHIRVRLRMVRDAAPYLTQGASFWVVRPRIGSGGVSGLETLISGSYVGIDPGPHGAEPVSEFTGLEEPPLIRSDVPGTRYLLRSERLGSIGRGSGVYFRGVEVGQVLGSELTEDHREIDFPVFVRTPYDQLVRTGTRFWNASGISVQADASGVNVEVSSLQAVLTGGIEFDTVTDSPPAPAETPFRLYPSLDEVTDAAYTERIPAIVYFEGSVRGLKVGSPVEVRGLKIGEVKDIRLVYDASLTSIRIPVRIELEPQRIVAEGAAAPVATPDHMILRTLVERGLRAQLQTASLITGELLVAFDFFPGAPRVELTMEGSLPVLPTVPTQLESITASVSGVLNRIAALPLEPMVSDLRQAIASVNALVGAPEVKQTLLSVDRTMTDIQQLTSQLRSDLGPSAAALRKTLEEATVTLEQARGTVRGFDGFVGESSPLRREIAGLVRELQVAARSIRVFADYLERHPEALIRGKGAPGR